MEDKETNTYPRQTIVINDNVLDTYPFFPVLVYIEFKPLCKLLASTHHAHKKHAFDAAAAAA